ncbi:chorionic somatomammotropin hormone 1-like isoform X2 [Cervus elaphus]|uniref:chorionic somatomammotropin hormone 1-like isoform X2 n=1 Tax=Cervus canadensis TaxID=1574408 RepID=UPI001CA37728|nr:chorionic somatomammotropin hormone 1-like isoform X2 [Cervus canadensis]XP_043764772.1 chorionic somatomammotropin hormone 1-like isoform X2 [Cervus elaphus]
MVARFSSLGIPHDRFPPFCPVGPSPHQQQSSSWDFSPIPMAPASNHRGHQRISDLVQGSCLLLLLVVSNPLLCQGEDYAPYCKNQTGECRIPLQNLFDTATMVANYNRRLAREMFDEFDKILFRLVVSLLHSWDEPLHHLVTELLRLKEASPDLLSKAAEIEEKTKVLLEGVEEIQKRVHPEEQEKETSYPVWSELSSLMSEDDDVNKTTFYKMFHCLQRDSSKIETYLQMLKCRYTTC